MPPPHETPIYREHFSSYDHLRWHPAQPLAVLHQWYERGDDTGAHQHEDFYTLYVVRAGRGLHVIDGHAYPVVRGDVYMTRPGAVHRYCHYVGLRAEALCFQATLFSDDELAALRALPGFWYLFVSPGETVESQRRDYRIHLSPGQCAEVERMLAELFAEQALAAPESQLLVHGLLFRLFVYLARAGGATMAEPAGVVGPSARLAEVVRFCEAHFVEEISVPQLAALAFLSPSHFSELFVREMGISPAAYLQRLRLEHGQTLLRTTSLSITEIAQQSGFRDSAQFARTFRQAFALTPSAYRQAFGSAYASPRL
jgi:AraC-like DNA-binding protein/mannose-6-phosphate isomerase-like protein (cupin superfamily)